MKLVEGPMIKLHIAKQKNLDYPWYNFDVLGFWRDNENSFPYLSSLAKRILGGTIKCYVERFIFDGIQLLHS
jgi:hypothetical protein